MRCFLHRLGVLPSSPEKARKNKAPTAFTVGAQGWKNNFQRASSVCAWCAIIHSSLVGTTNTSTLLLPALITMS